MESKPTEKLPVEDPLTRRLGIVRIDMYHTRREPSFLLSMFGNFVVLRVDYKWESNSLEYLGLSPRFDLCAAGCIPPIYEAVFQTDNNGARSFVAFVK